MNLYFSDMLFKTTYIVLVVAGMSGVNPSSEMEMVCVHKDKTIVQLDMVCQEYRAITPLIDEETIYEPKLGESHPIHSILLKESTLDGHLPRKEEAPDLYTELRARTVSVMTLKNTDII